MDRLKSNFVSAISHDLRTPLTSIRGYAEFLEDEIGGPLSPEQHAFVAQLMRGAIRLEHLVDDLLDFARLDAGTFKLRCETSDLAERLYEVAASLRPQVEEARLQLVVEPPAGPLVAEMDEGRVERVLFNLLHNAIKFTPAGGTIRVRAWRRGGQLRCEVQDSGPGISSPDQARLFQRFSQLQSGSEKGGTGLGLSICRAIIDAHGGAIGVSSQPGHGATFWFTLPADAAG
jgi:signal transduction histidine kinase